MLRRRAKPFWPTPTGFWDRCIPEPNTGCWLWQDCTHAFGYGLLKVGGRQGPTVRAHRIAWNDRHGPIPEGLVVCHRCDNPPCINPDHLFLGTHADNNKDKCRKGRAAGGSLKGVIHPGAKLDDQKVIDMRALYAGGDWRTSELGKRFGVSQQVAWKVVHRQLWRHVPESAQ